MGIPRVNPDRLLGRSIFGSAAMTLYYLSIELGTPGRASLFNNSFPLFVAVIAIVILKDTVRIATVAGLLVAFTGVSLVLWDGSGISALGDIFGIASGFLAGISYHFNKVASKTEDPIVIYLGVCLVGIAINAFSTPQAAGMDWIAALLLVLAGLGGYFAQIAITVGLRDIPATEGSVHTFMKIPVTALAGALFLGNAVTPRFIVGTALLVASLIINQTVFQKKPDCQ